jgi:hypothetical protein
MLALCGSAQASTVISSESGTSYRYQRWVDRAKVPTPNVTLTVVEEGCVDDADYATGCTSPGSYVVRVATESQRRYIRRAFLHELGHNFDYYEMDAVRRAWFGRTVGLTGAWVSRELGSSSPHELFAETYAQCASGAWRVTEMPVFLDMRSACYVIRH